ncbi:flagellar hook capping FlgD N-terminal domain-containing protein [Bacillus sp. BP-3]|nr:flagellar hook capping FlgD N-terminal domain-containing protein [Bacillus sp. BP-3]MDC2865761.1 flagellar hook capping FlgD N-terminal domain-containing protein [Bacillus sp. BP-3]
MPSIGLNTTNTNQISAPQMQNNGIASATQQKTNGVMGKDDFLKLFLTSLQYQDPSNAMDMNQMMNQMSQMSLMEQVQNMTKAVDSLRETMYTTPLDSGMKFLGKYVRGVDGNGTEVQGKVDTVRLGANNDVQLVIGSKVVSLRFVERVSDQEIDLSEGTQPTTETTNK